MLFEIRNYHFEPTLFEEYKSWAKDYALPFLDRKLDLVGFWATEGESDVTGVAMDELGSANITWIIKWPDRASRDQTMSTLFTGQEWDNIFKHLPGGIDAYRRMEAKFTKDLLG